MGKEISVVIYVFLEWFKILLFYKSHIEMLREFLSFYIIMSFIVL